MKTLQKIALVAFAVLSAGVANAQTNPCMNCMPPVTPKPGPNADPGCITCGVSPNNIATDRARSAAVANRTEINTSFVFQNGDNQFACVEQTGTGGNQADLIQDAKGTSDDGTNNAWQFQSNTSTDAASGHGKNTAWAQQLGDHSMILQTQTGSNNKARANQGDWDRNIAYQNQTGYSNTAVLGQEYGHDNYSVQVQKGYTAAPVGHDNLSTVSQYNGGNWSVTEQEGHNNTAAVFQH